MATSEQDIASNIPCRRIALVSGCTMKEYDQLISDLKKENFSLKLRIYYMEEKLQQTFGDGHDVLKMNVQLQTEIDSLKQELIDKQVLIQKAAFAIETLTADRDKEEEIRNRLRAGHEKELAQLCDQLDKANQSNDLSHSEVDKARTGLEKLKQQLNDTTRELAAAVEANEAFKKTLEEMKLEQKQKDALLDRYKRSVEGLVKTLQQKSEECEDLRAKVDEGSEQIQVLQSGLKERQLQNSKLHDLSLKQLHDVRLLMDFLHKEMKSLAHSSQQPKINTGEVTNLNDWVTEVSSVQRVYQKLQKLVKNNSHLYQTLMFSVQARQEHSDSVESSFYCGQSKLEPILQIPGFGEVSSSHGKEQSGLGSLVQTSAETGKTLAQSGVVVVSPGNVSDRPPAGSAMLNEVDPDGVDRFLQSDVILSNINWWLQMPARLETEGREKLITVNDDTDLNHAQKPQSHPTSGRFGINNSSMDLFEDFSKDSPEVNISGVSTVEELKKCIQEMVSGVESSENLIRGNQEKINVPSLHSQEELKSNPVDNLRNISEMESVTTSNVIAISTSGPNCSKSMAADSKQELFATYSQGLDNFHKFSHAEFFDDNQYDIRRHDRASSMRFDSQNATLTGMTASEHMTSTPSSHWSTGDSHPISRVCDTASLSQVEEAQNERQLAEVDQNVIGTQQQSDVDKNIFDNQHPTDINQNKLGCQDNAHLEANIQIKELEEKLKATENTVKLLSRKNKVCLSVLKASGICVNFMNRSNSESCLGSPSASSGERASSMGSLSRLTPGRTNESIERPRSFICDSMNQTADVTRGFLDASVVATPSRASVSLVDDTTRISETSADILNLTTQSRTGKTNPAVSENSSALDGDHASNTNSNNHNTSYVGNDSASFLTLTASSPTASLNGSMQASPSKHPHDVSLLSKGHHGETAIPSCLNHFDGQHHTSMDTPVGSHEEESFVKPSLNVTGVSEKGPQEVTYSSIVDGSWMNHRDSLDGSGVTPGRHPNVTYSSVLDTVANHGVKSVMDVSGVSRDRHLDPEDSSTMDNTLMNHEVKTNMDMSYVRQDMHPDGTYSSNIDHTLISDGNNVDTSGVSRARSPDVTYSSIMNGSLMNRLLNNLEHSLSALKDDTWNSADLSVGQLRNHVEHLERVNLALKEDIRVYETLHCLQASQTASDKSSRQSRTDQELPEENFKSYNESKGQVPSEEDLLRPYLTEIRKIRQRLEKLDLVKNPDQLLIFQSHTHQRILHQETVIAHLQQLMVEKETLWQQEISELDHKLSREKVLAVEKLEGTISQLQTTVREQAKTIREQEKQIVNFKLSLEQRDKEEEIMKGEKADLEGHFLKLNTTCVNNGKGLDWELEEKQKEIEMLKVELGKEKDSWRHLKEIVVKRERSLQEKIFALQKLTNEKVIVEDTVKEKEAEIRMLELELGSLREKLQRMEAALEERTTLVDRVEFLKEELREREHQEVRFDFQKMRYDAEIEKITEEKVKLSLDLETESREKERLKLRLGELEHKVLEKVKLERQNNELKGEIKSLLSEVDKLNTKVTHRVVQEREVRNRLRMVGETESQVNMLREQLLKCEDNLRVAEQLRNGALEEVKELGERLKKRNEQLHHLLQQYKKLEAAFIKQKSKLKEKTDLLQKLKKQIQLHEHSPTCSSDHSLSETNLMLDSENYSADAATFTSTPVSSPAVKEQHSDSMSVKHCRRQLTYSAVDIQPSEARLLTSASDTCCSVAVLTRDCHQRLYKKAEECLFILTDIESRLGHTLEMNKADSGSQNKESSILRETYTSCQRLGNCLREAASCISSARITELPGSKIQAPNYQPVMGPQNGNLRTGVQELPPHGTILQSFTQQQSKLYKTQMTWEKTLYKQCKLIVRS